MATNWTDTLFHPDPPFKIVDRNKQVFQYKPCENCGLISLNAECHKHVVPGFNAPFSLIDIPVLKIPTPEEPGWVSYKFKWSVQKPPNKPNLSWPDRGNTPIAWARYALNRLFGKRDHDGVAVETLRQEFEKAFFDGMIEGQAIEKRNQESLRRAKMLMLEEELRRKNEQARAVLEKNRWRFC